MLFDLICAITVIGLTLKGLKEIFLNRLALIVSLIIALSISSFLIPIYSQYIKIPFNLPSNISSFIITFILSYLLLTLPAFFLKVAFGGLFLIFIYAIIISFIPVEYRELLIKNSYIYSILKPVLRFVFQFLSFIKLIK